jgi:WD40 repeat protein
MASYATRKTFKSELKIASLSFTPTGKFLLIEKDAWGESAEEATGAPTPPLEVRSVSDGEKVSLNLDLKEPVLAADFSDDDRFVILQNKKIVCWDLANNAKVNEFSYEKELGGLSFTPDGKFVITGDDKGELQVWDVATGKSGPSLTIGDTIQDILVSPDGSSFVAVTDTWLHRIEIFHQQLRYCGGIFTARSRSLAVHLFPQVNPNSEVSGWPVRWIEETARGLQAHTASFDGKSSRPVLNGDADDLLFDWKRKLSFNVDPLGYLASSLREPSAPSAAPSPKP